MTQNQVLCGLWVGDDQYDGADYDYIIDLRDWDCDKTFAEKDYQYIDGILHNISTGLKVGKTLVHCHGGMDRSPFVVALYLHLYHKKTPFEAYEYVKKRRPQTIIHDEWMFPYIEYHSTPKNMELMK